MSGSLTQMRILTGEAIRDAFRRKVVTTIIIVSLLSLWLMDGCTSCVPADFEVNGQTVSELGWVGFAGIAIFGAIALWTVVLSGLLASDHLTETMDDGSVALVLSKPVGRISFALARLAGSLSVSLATSALLLAAAALFISIRHQLPLPPAALAAVMTFTGSAVAAALAMTLSLYFKRISTFLLVFFFVAVVSATNIQMLVGGDPTGLMGILNIFGPPFATSIGASLLPWAGQELQPGMLALIYLRLLVWVALSVGAMVLAFRRVEISA